MVSRNVREVTLALVGHGRWGSNYIKTISSLKNCVLPTRYIVSRNYETLAAYRDIDGVIIATPAGTHYEIAKFFIENKFNVLIEKPVTSKFTEAQKLVKLQEKNKVVGMVGHVYEYHHDFQKMLSKLNRSKIRYIYTEGLGNGPIRKDISALWDWAPHDIGMCVRIVGKTPISVACWEQVTNAMYFIKLIFPLGITSVSRIGWLSPERKRTVLVCEENQTLHFDDNRKDTSLYKSPLAYELAEFVECIKNRKESLTNLAYGATIVRIIEAAEKSAHGNGKLVML